MIPGSLTLTGGNEQTQAALLTPAIGDNSVLSELRVATASFFILFFIFAHKGKEYFFQPHY